MSDETIEVRQAIAVSEATAFGLARRNHLVGDNGTVTCWNCGERDALIPSLHCGLCLRAHYARTGIVLPFCMNRAQTDADRAAMRR